MNPKAKAFADLMTKTFGREPFTDDEAAQELNRKVTVMTCDSCGQQATEFREGSCVQCADAAQAVLDRNNAAFDRWEAMTDRQRGDEIKKAM